MDNPTRILLSPRAFADRHRFSIGKVRWLLFKKPNDFNKCVRRLSNRILIDEELFFEWLDRSNGIYGQRGER